MLKKLTAILSVLVLMMGSVAYAQENIIIDVSAINALELTITEWYGGKGYRELLVALMLLDLSDKEEAIGIAATAI